MKRIQIETLITLEWIAQIQFTKRYYEDNKSGLKMKWKMITLDIIHFRVGDDRRHKFLKKKTIWKFV